MSAPNVIYKEKDLSQTSDSNDSIYIAIVIPALKGPVEKPTIGSSEPTFLKTFTPNSKIEIGFPTAYWSALKVLESTGNLVVVRAASATAKFAGAYLANSTSVGPGDAGLTQFSAGVLDLDSVELTSQSQAICAANQGSWGDDISVSVFTYKESETTVVDSSSTFTTTQRWGAGFPVKVAGVIPAELNAADTYFVVPVANGKIKLAATQANAVASTPVTITVAATTGVILTPAIQYTKIPGTYVVRVFVGTSTSYTDYLMSKDTSAKDGNGNGIYCEDVTKYSNLIRVVDNPLVTNQVADQVIPVSLNGGSDGTAVTDADCIRALATLSNVNGYKIKAILDGGRTTANYHAALITLCESRHDCVPILSAPYALQVGDSPAQDIVNYRKFDANFNTSFGALYAPHVQIYDKYNDRRTWVSPDGVVGKAIVDTYTNYEIWYPVGGNIRGVVNVLDVAVRFSGSDEDLLYDNGINPIRYTEGKGIRIWGQKTLLATPSMLDRLNVRLLLNWIGPDIKDELENFLFDFNDDTTRTMAKAKVDSYMKSIEGRRGVTKFLTICDLTNNTTEDIDNHIMRLDLLVCPNDSTEWIPFTIGITNNSVSFDLAAQSL